MAVQYCVVDGRPSTRPSWNLSFVFNSVTYVACDFHSLPAIWSAIQNIAAGTAPSTSPSAPVPSSKNHNKQIPEPAGA